MVNYMQSRCYLTLAASFGTEKATAVAKSVERIASFILRFLLSNTCIVGMDGV